MNERNTNRSRRTPNSRTTQRHQIDGRPAPRRQASQPDYLHGSPQSAPRGQHQPERSRQSRSRAQQQNRPRAQQRAPQERPYQRQPRPAQHSSSRRRANTPSHTAQRMPVHEQHSYQALNPRQGTGTYVRHGYSKKRSRVPYFVGGAAVLVLAVFLVTTLAGAFSGSKQSTQEETPEAAAPAPSTLTVTFAGDCTLGTDVNFSSDTSFNTKYEAVDDPSYFFANVADIFKNDDLTVVNMEGTLTTSSARQDKTFAFKGPADYAQILVKGNVETASLANNHSHDYGDQSYTDTISALENAGIGTFGYDRIDYRDVNGVKVALIGTYELAKHLDIQDELKQNIQTAKENGAQLVAVFFHWGNEKETVPDETQVQLGHIAVDSGADLVIGSHPHVIQGYEKYNGRYIVYSLGNFCFGGNPNPSDKDCMIFQQTFTVTGNDVATDDNINVIPCSISSTSSSNNYQPAPATGSEKSRIEAKIKESSDSIATLSSKVSQSS